MAEKIVSWCSKDELSCARCFPADVILCVSDDKLLPYQCEEGNEGSIPYPINTIPAILKDSKLLRDNCGKIIWKYFFEYDDEYLISPEEGLSGEDIEGVLCAGCLTSYMHELVGNEVKITLLEGGGFTLTNQYGCAYTVQSGGASVSCDDVRSCINVNPLTIEGDGTEENPFSAVQNDPTTCEDVLNCIHVDPETIDGDGSEAYPFSAIQTPLDCEEVSDCICLQGTSWNLLRKDEDGCLAALPPCIDDREDNQIQVDEDGCLYVPPPAEVICEDVLNCIHVDPETIDGDGSEAYPFSAITTAPPLPPVVSLTRIITPGGWYDANTNGSTYVNGGVAGNTLQLCPFMVGVPFNIDMIGVNCSVQSVTNTVKFCVYETNDQGIPTNKVLQTSDVVITSTGFFGAAVSFSFLDNRLYWLGIQIELTGGMSLSGYTSTEPIGLYSATAHSTANEVHFYSLGTILTYSTDAPAMWSWDASDRQPFSQVRSIRVRAV